MTPSPSVLKISVLQTYDSLKRFVAVRSTCGRWRAVCDVWTAFCDMVDLLARLRLLNVAVQAAAPMSWGI